MLWSISDVSVVVTWRDKVNGYNDRPMITIGWAGHSIECITHAGHSIAFNVMRFATLTFDLIGRRGIVINDGLSLCQVWRF